MNARKAQLAGLAAILALTTAGCGLATDASDTPAAAPTSTKPLDPKLKLIDAVPGEQDGAYQFEVTGSETPASGVLDAPHRATLLKIVQHETAGPTFTLTMTTLVVDKQTWIKMAFTPADLRGLPKVPKSWQLLDAAKVKEKGLVGYDGSLDPGYTQLLVQKATAVKETSPGHFSGTTDLTQSTDAEIVDEKTLAKLGAKAKAVPFTATIDAKGNLTSLIAQIPAAGGVKARTYSVKYAGFGTTATLAAPAAGDQQKATSVVYQMLAG
jgi:hypothetical protein